MVKLVKFCTLAALKQPALRLKRYVDGENLKETIRIEAFSDGVFAIAITLLVLELIETLHSENGAGLLHTFYNHWQSFFAFIIGFVTILVCWINHHAAFECIRKVDTNLIWINGFLLFLVTLTPLPTAILAEYLEKESTTALAIFGFNYVAISIAAWSICAYAYHRNIIHPESRVYYRYYIVLYRYAIFFTIFAFLLCFVSTIIPIILYIFMFSVFAAPKKFALYLSRRTKRKSQHVKYADRQQ
jgi:uncharacterized membrane protein